MGSKLADILKVALPVLGVGAAAKMAYDKLPKPVEVNSPEQKKEFAEQDARGEIDRDFGLPGMRPVSLRTQVLSPEEKKEFALKKARGEIKYEAGIPGMRGISLDTGYREAGSTYKKGGKVSGASKRGDGITQRGKTKGRFV
jgi:hypothetical protein